jgi:hypothetical protein
VEAAGNPLFAVKTAAGKAEWVLENKDDKCKELVSGLRAKNV